MVWPAIIAGATTLASGAMSSSSQSGANKMNLQIAREANAFSERMSNTAHRREKADLIAAGMNPLLSVNAGADAPVGQGAHMENVSEGLVHSAGQLNDIINKKAQRDVMREQEETQRVSQTLMKAQAERERASAISILGDIPKKTAEGKVYSGVASMLDPGLSIGGKLMKELPNAKAVGDAMNYLIDNFDSFDGAGVPVPKHPFGKKGGK